MLVYPLSTDPPEAAKMLCDQHLKWMPNHISFLLASALERRGAKPLHYTEKLLPNHPWAVWASESLDNFWWLAEFGKMICIEYSIRWSKSYHRSESDMSHYYYQAQKLEDWEGGFTPFPQVMPEKYKSNNSIESYRLYYLNSVIVKSNASWSKCKKFPEWWKRLLSEHRNL